MRLNTLSSHALDSAKEIALALTEKERAELARTLVASLDGPADPDVADKWEAEILRRIEQIDNGNAEFLTVEETMERLRLRLHAT
jgi:putative addiction module component (TIGR02574 family)